MDGESVFVWEKDFYKRLLILALPVAFKAFITRGVLMLDNIMVGSMGDVAISSVALANQVSTFFSFIIAGLSGGASVLIAQYWGKKDMERIKSVFSIVFITGVAIGVMVTAFVFFFPEKAMGIFSSDTAIIKEGVQYITIVCFSYLLFALSESMVSMLRCVEIVQITLWISVTSLFTNLFFNYVLIYGKLGFPAMGVKGAAIATVITRLLEFLVVAVYLFYVQKRIAITPLALLKTDKKMWVSFGKYGVPILAGDMQWGLVGLVKASIIGHVGARMVAAFSITDAVLSMAGIFAAGLGNAACVVIGKSIGEGDLARTRRYANTLQLLFFVSGLAMCALIFSLRAVLVSFYHVTEETAALAHTFISLGSLIFIGTFYHATCFTGINRGAGDGKFVLKVDMICGWLIVIPLSFLAGHVLNWPLPVVFVCLYIDQCFKWIIAFFRLRGKKWIRNVTQAK